MADLSLRIEGMHCAGCAATVEKALRQVAGVNDAVVNLMAGTARVTGAAEEGQLMRAVQAAGYRASVMRGMSAEAVAEMGRRGAAEEAGVRHRLILGLLFGIPAMVTEMLLHHREFLDREFMRIYVHVSFQEGYDLLAAALATLVMIVTGWPFFVRGFRAAIRGRANMDTLVALGAGTAYGASAVSLAVWLANGHEGMTGMAMPALSEFHAAVAIVVLVTLGKYLEARAKRRAMAGVAGLAERTAAMATRIAGDGSREAILAERIELGDRVEILAHQRLPVDGVLVEGTGSLDVSVVTGESAPVELQAVDRSRDRKGAVAAEAEGGVSEKSLPDGRGSEGGRKSLSLAVLGNVARGGEGGDMGDEEKKEILPGGAMLLDGRIVIRAASTAGTSAVARILELVNAAQASKTKIQGLADRVAGIFVPVVLGLGVVNFLGWILLGGGWERALLTTIATIVIACPCAMGLATPTAITVAMGRAAKMGILFTRAAALESGREIGTVVFDKTGTLTTGKLELAGMNAECGMRNAELAEALGIGAALGRWSEHPVARAVVEAGRGLDGGVGEMAVEGFSSVAGGGLRGRIGGRDYVMGSRGFLEGLGVEDGAGRFGALGTMVGVAEIEQGKTKLLRVLEFRDGLRADATATIRLLRARGIRVGVLSGDHEAAVRAALQGIEVDFVKAGVRPEGKAAVIAELKRESGADRKRTGVAFVGDGVNDGPALAAADLGIAMGTGTEVAKGAGDVLLLGDRLAAVPAVLELSRRTLAVIKQNLFWAFGYNVAAIPLAMAGVLPPGVAAGAMMFSSLSVVANALRLYRVRLMERKTATM